MTAGASITSGTAGAVQCTLTKPGVTPPGGAILRGQTISGLRSVLRKTTKESLSVGSLRFLELKMVRAYT